MFKIVQAREGEGVEVRVLGPRLVVKDDGGAPIAVSRRQVRELLCVLAVERGAVVSAAALVELLWDPGDASRSRGPRQAIYYARQVLPAGRLRSEAGGYRFHLTGADYLDLIEFQQLTDQARAVHDVAPQTAADFYRRALGLGGTPLLGDLPPTVGAAPLRQSLLGGLQDAREELAETLLQLRRYREVIDSAANWLCEDPYNEHLVGLLMLALAHAGRTGEALHAYHDLLALLGPRTKPGGWVAGVAAQIKDNSDGEWTPRPVHLATDAQRHVGGVDTNNPSSARVYDVLLGGKDNFAVDRAAASMLIESYPEAPQIARLNRAWVNRVVRYLVQAGVDQFIDIGTGLPTLSNVHEIARRALPDARVLYVDNDPLVCTYGRALLTTEQGVELIQADASRPQEILENPTTRALIDFTRPVAILLATVMHFVPDRDDPKASTRAYVHALPPGGYLALSHSTFPPDVDLRTARTSVSAKVWAVTGCTRATVPR